MKVVYHNELKQKTRFSQISEPINFTRTQIKSIISQSMSSDPPLNSVKRQQEVLSKMRDKYLGIDGSKPPTSSMINIDLSDEEDLMDDVGNENVDFRLGA